MLEWLWLLLPIAAASGWYTARRSNLTRKDKTPTQSLHLEYYKGINHLLNEQPDEAINTLIRILEVDHETTETHLALGHLYRRRGEIDRAIRIHQNLIDQFKLEPEKRNESLLELAQDYLSAGLLDRAEGLFREVSSVPTYKAQAMYQLMGIYEQGKDWQKAIDTIRELTGPVDAELNQIIAQYLCENAEKARAGNDIDSAFAFTEEALKVNPHCARANIIRGDICLDIGDFQRAQNTYIAIEEQSPEFLPEIVERVRRCFEALNNVQDLKRYLMHLLHKFGGMTTVTLALAEIIYAEHGKQKACKFIIEQLHRRPTLRGFERLVELELSDTTPAVFTHLPALKALVIELLEHRPAYRCSGCGFSGQSLHWQCPSCKRWETVLPIQGVDGE